MVILFTPRVHHQVVVVVVFFLRLFEILLPILHITNKFFLLRWFYRGKYENIVTGVKMGFIYTAYQRVIRFKQVSNLCHLVSVLQVS